MGPIEIKVEDDVSEDLESAIPYHEEEPEKKNSFKHKKETYELKDFIVKVPKPKPNPSKEANKANGFTSTGRPLICQECDTQFSSTQSLKYHIKGIHKKIKDFICR